MEELGETLCGAHVEASYCERLEQGRGGKFSPVAAVAAVLLAAAVSLASDAAGARPPRLGRAPSSCAAGATVQRSQPPGFHILAFGTKPLWVFAYAEWSARTQALRANQDPRFYRRRRLGWPIKFLWEVDAAQRDPLEVTIRSRRTGRPIWLAIGGQREPYLVDSLTRTPVLDPAHPGHPDIVDPPLRHEWGSIVYFPRAGCYQLSARWPDGSWTFVFGFGR